MATFATEDMGGLCGKQLVNARNEMAENSRLEMRGSKQVRNSDFDHGTLTNWVLALIFRP